jgi:hypothetical protein
VTTGRRLGNPPLTAPAVTSIRLSRRRSGLTTAWRERRRSSRWFGGFESGVRLRGAPCARCAAPPGWRQSKTAPCRKCVGATGCRALEYSVLSFQR